MRFARSFRLAIGVLAVVSAAGAAAAQDVAYNAMPGTNFATFKTFKWVPIDGAVKPDQRQENIAKAVTKMLKNYPPPVKK